MFAALNSNEATLDAASVGSQTANSTRPPSQKGNVDFSVGSVIDGRKRLFLQPRTQAVTSDAGSFSDDARSAIGQSEQGYDEAASATTAAAPTVMSVDQAKRKIRDDIKELFMLRQPSEAEGYFSSLPPEFRWQLVTELVSEAIDAKPVDVQLVSDVFSVAASKSLVEEAQFSQGFNKDMEYLEDISTDSPNAYGNIASLLNAANLSQAAVERCAWCPFLLIVQLIRYTVWRIRSLWKMKWPSRLRKSSSENTPP
jgi:translation initiation factor 4G